MQNRAGNHLSTFICCVFPSIIIVGNSTTIILISLMTKPNNPATFDFVMVNRFCSWDDPSLWRVRSLNLESEIYANLASFRSRFDNYALIRAKNPFLCVCLLLTVHIWTGCPENAGWITTHQPSPTEVVCSISMFSESVSCTHWMLWSHLHICCLCWKQDFVINFA